MGARLWMLLDYGKGVGGRGRGAVCERNFYVYLFIYLYWFGFGKGRGKGIACGFMRGIYLHSYPLIIYYGTFDTHHILREEA